MMVVAQNSGVGRRRSPSRLKRAPKADRVSLPFHYFNNRVR